jgi:beta-lactam-binding protein with PASTA domain
MSSVYSVTDTGIDYVTPGYWVSGYAVPETVFPNIWQYTNTLVNTGLILNPSVWWEPSPNSAVPYGYIIAINPASGTQVNEWTPIQVTVSNGPASTATTITMPNVVGLQQYQAYEAINNAGFIINTNAYTSSNTVPQGYVIAQSLSVGTVTSPGTVVSLTISTGPATSALTAVVP